MLENWSSERSTGFDVLDACDFSYHVFCVTENTAYFKHSGDHGLDDFQEEKSYRGWVPSGRYGDYLICQKSEGEVERDLDSVFGLKLKHTLFDLADLTALGERPVDAAFYRRVSTCLQLAIGFEREARVLYDFFVLLRPDNVLPPALDVREASARFMDAINKAGDASKPRFICHNTIKSNPDNSWRVNSHAPIVFSRGMLCALWGLSELFQHGNYNRYLLKNRLGNEFVFDPKAGDLIEASKSNLESGGHFPVSFQTEMIVGEYIRSLGSQMYDHQVNLWAYR